MLQARQRQVLAPAPGRDFQNDRSIAQRRLCRRENPSLAASSQLGQELKLADDLADDRKAADDAGSGNAGEGPLMSMFRVAALSVVALVAATGLAQAQDAMGDKAAADATRKEFAAAWMLADTKLTASRF